jgi:hypothetical protein
MTDYTEGARQMQAAGKQYRVEAPGDGRMILYLTDHNGDIQVYDLPMEHMVSIGRDILRVYHIILERAMQVGQDG